MWEKQKFFLKTLTNKSRGHDGSRKLPLSNHHSGNWFRYRVEGCLGQNIVYSEYFPAKYLWITKENIYIMMSKSARHQYGQMVKFNVNHRCDGLILCAPDMMYEKKHSTFHVVFLPREHDLSLIIKKQPDLRNKLFKN